MSLYNRRFYLSIYRGRSNTRIIIGDTRIITRLNYNEDFQRFHGIINKIEISNDVIFNSMFYIAPFESTYSGFDDPFYTGEPSGIPPEKYTDKQLIEIQRNWKEYKDELNSYLDDHNKEIDKHFNNFCILNNLSGMKFIVEDSDEYSREYFMMKDEDKYVISNNINIE